MEPLDKQIAPPGNWATFEDLTRALFAGVWNNPLTRKNGRTGQAQHGVDVFGEPADRPGEVYGVQCKGKTRALNAKATKKEFDAELKKAEKFTPPLARWIFTTTAADDGPLQKHVREVSAARVKAGKFPVDVLGWDSILALLVQQPKVLRQFYPEHVSPLPDDVAKLEAASDAALAAIEDSLRHGETCLSLVRPRLWQALRDGFQETGMVRIVGDGGAGKSGLLRRLGGAFSGPRLVLKDNRITATSLQQHLAQLDIASGIDELLDDLAGPAPALCLIDGADRLLMSERRGVVTDLLAALARSPARQRWKLVTTARTFQDHDLVTSALKDAGFADQGIALRVKAIDDADASAIAGAFPAFAPLVRRDDLGGQNRSLFLIRELLRSATAPAGAVSEVDMAGAWATASSANTDLSARRSKALSELGRRLAATPGERPARADFDPIGLQALIEEGSVIVLLGRDSVALTYDVHEDWLVARSLDRERARLPDILRAAGEPLWWRRAVRLAGQILLEAGHRDEWAAGLAALDTATDLDPAWARAMLVAPLHSERNADILPELEVVLLADDAALLARLLDTLLVSETAIDDEVIASPALAHLSEAERYTFAAYWKEPILRSWGAFLRWSLPLWRTWPPDLIPRLAELALIFTRATSRVPNGYSQAIADICAEWLREIEQSEYFESWKDRRSPFGLDLPRERWREAEKQLREALSCTADSAPSTVAGYLARLARSPELTRAREKLIEAPQRVPMKLPAAWTDMCLAHFVPHRRTYRPGPESPFGAELFPFHSYDSAGIRNGHGFSPSSPLRGGFAVLFEADEREALRLVHRLEMRATVFWRWYMKCHDRRRPIPTILELPWGKVTLWGDDAVYRWSRGVLGPRVLGSAYLALDQWLAAQAAKGRPPEELIRLALQHNGLVASASSCIAMLVDLTNTKGAIDLAGPFLAEPRLWQFDIRRHIDDRGSAHRIGFWSPDNIHYQAVERLYQRRKTQQPLSHALLLPFRLMAGSDPQRVFDARRSQWEAQDVATYEDELDDAEQRAKLEARIERCRSDGDPTQIEIERGPEDGQVMISIAPPAAAAEEIAAIAAQQERSARASRLANWVNETRERKAPHEALSVSDAIALAKALIAEFAAAHDAHDDGFSARIAGAGIVGTAAVAAIWGTDALVQADRGWIEQWLREGARLRRADWETEITVDAAILPYDAQVLAGWGMAGMACRFPGDPDLDEMVLALTVQRLHAVTEAVLEGLDWAQRPDFARNVTVTALDSCVIDVGHWWWGEKERVRARKRTDRLRERAISRAFQTGAADRAPVRPPAPFEWRWIWSWRKLELPRRLKLKARTVLDWNRATSILKRVDWAHLTASDDGVRKYADYLDALVRWTQSYSEDDAERYDGQFPHEWGGELARAIGRFAGAHGREQDWAALRVFTYHDRAEELVGDYLDAIAHDLVDSGRPPDARFWTAWRPAAEWIMATCVPSRRGRHDHLPQFVRAAGFVGPYTTPIPPDWSYLEALLEWIDGWVSATCHLPSAAYAVLPIIERMTVDQKQRWYLPWLARWVQRNQADKNFWAYNGLGEKAAALAKALVNAPQPQRQKTRQCLAIIADAGSPVARDVLPLFGAGRPKV